MWGGQLRIWAARRSCGSVQRVCDPVRSVHPTRGPAWHPMAPRTQGVVPTAHARYRHVASQGAVTGTCKTMRRTDRWTQTASLITVLSALCDGISDGLGCEMSRDSTDDGRSAHGHVNGRPTSRFATIRRVDRTELRCDDPQVQRRYADRASPRPNCSYAHRVRSRLGGPQT